MKAVEHPYDLRNVPATKIAQKIAGTLDEIPEDLCKRLDPFVVWGDSDQCALLDEAYESIRTLGFLKERGQLTADGSIKRTQEALNAQAAFAKSEMEDGMLGARGKRALGVLNNPNASHADRALALGDDVIKWRQHDPRHASHADKRDRYYGQIGGLVDGGGSQASRNHAATAEMTARAPRIVAHLHPSCRIER